MPRVLTAKVVGLWVLSAVLAAVFLIVGIPKIAGAENHWVRTFAMFGYPEWLRIVVGIVETLGAILLLIPASAGFAATALALLMLGATYAQLTVGEPIQALLPIALFILLATVAFGRRARSVRQAHPEIHETANRIIREGLIAGFLGATAVAIWFLIVDMVAGRPLFTPQVLGEALFSFFGPVPDGESDLLHVLGYTIFHYTAFAAVGTLVASIVHVAQKQPAVLAGSLILFVIVEIGFHALVALLQETTILGALAWYQVMAGNLIAAALMGAYMWRTHPELAAEFAHALDGTE
jgi:uncharacterized membrane protein YphA (DoxX/SURF4 family)